MTDLFFNCRLSTLDIFLLFQARKSDYVSSFNQIRPLLLIRYDACARPSICNNFQPQGMSLPTGPDQKMKSGSEITLPFAFKGFRTLRPDSQPTNALQGPDLQDCTGIRTECGLTILEVIVVLVLIGILSAVIWSKPLADTTLVARVEAIKAHLRYAQVRSMNTERRWGIQSDGNSYWLFADGDPAGTKVILPGQTKVIVSLAEHGISITPFLLTFDQWGRPCSDAAAQSPITTGLVLTATAHGQPSQQILVTPDTGFIP